MIVGSEDYEIRVFKDDNILNEIRETEAVTSLAALRGNCFAYGLENCTVGVYEKQQRLWRVKVTYFLIFVCNCIIITLLCLL